jgi:hypothetical protein
MKKSLCILLVVSVLVTFCKKPAKEATDPYVYSSDIQTSKDLTAATFIVTDIDMLAGFLGENDLFNHCYLPQPGSSTMSVTRDTSAKIFLAAFNNSKCVDGKTREGSVFFSYNVPGQDNAAAQYYREFGFTCMVNFSDYKVNGWKIELMNASVPAVIKNTVSSSQYDPKVTNLTWEFSGKLKLTNLSNGNFIYWEGTLKKMLLNTSDPAVFNPNKQSAINFNKARIVYGGSFSGTTSDLLSYTVVIDDGNPILRDLNCAFVPGGSPGVTHYHPFIGGMMAANVSNFHPRTIWFGPNGTCDNMAVISFKGENHEIELD